MTSLASLVEAGALSSIDAGLADLLTRRSARALGDTDEARHVGLVAAMLSAERARGHSCLRLEDITPNAAPWAEVVGPGPSSAEEWRALLCRSGVCGDGSAPSPMVLDGDRVYLFRYHAAERRLAGAMRSRILGAPDEGTEHSTVSLFRRLFPASPSTTDWQAVAAAAALRNQFTVITGGPGTGKTTTVARIIALMLERTPDLRVALTAPTGKAAARLAESIRTTAGSLPVNEAIRAAMPADGRTLHRLLGYRPWDDRFARNPDEPLTEDVVVVDEASMVDVLMMDALFAALRPTTKVILLGDQDQLASVDTGFALGDVCRAADRAGSRHGAGLSQWFEKLSGQALERDMGALPVRDAVVRLQHSWRFDAQPGIAEVATAMRTGDAAAALGVLKGAERADVAMRAAPRTTAELLEPLAEEIQRYLASTTPAEALRRLSSFRILCAVREGETGVAGVNERVERWLLTIGVPTGSAWYHGRPVLIVANDPATGLYNGDVGVTFRKDGVTRVLFDGGDGVERSVAPARLPTHETAWAMTVHKAQGSEFDRVMLLLPDTDVAVLTRELLYTAVTRARSRVDVIGDAALLERGIARTTHRESGLADRLLEADA